MHTFLYDESCAFTQSHTFKFIHASLQTGTDRLIQAYAYEWIFEFVHKMNMWSHFTIGVCMVARVCVGVYECMSVKTYTHKIYKKYKDDAKLCPLQTSCCELIGIACIYVGLCICLDIFTWIHDSQIYHKPTGVGALVGACHVHTQKGETGSVAPRVHHSGKLLPNPDWA